MTFYTYLLLVEEAAREFELTRLSYEAAKERATRVSTSSFEPIARSGTVTYDQIAHRVAVLDLAREKFREVNARCGRTLKLFKSQLESCLNPDGCNVLWLKYVRGYDNARIAKTLDMDARHVWPMLKDARDVLRSHVGDEVPDYYACRGW